MCTKQTHAFSELTLVVTANWELIREFAPIVMLLGAVVWGLVHARHRLRPWYAWLSGLGALVSLPLTFLLLSEARAGTFTGWGGLGMILIFLPAVFVAAFSATALATLAVLVPRYGFNPPTKTEREAEWERRSSPEGQRGLAIFKLKFSVIGLAIVLLIIWLREFMR